MRRRVFVCIILCSLVEPKSHLVISLDIFKTIWLKTVFKTVWYYTVYPTTDTNIRRGALCIASHNVRQPTDRMIANNNLAASVVSLDRTKYYLSVHVLIPKSSDIVCSQSFVDIAYRTYSSSVTLDY